MRERERASDAPLREKLKKTQTKKEMRTTSDNIESIDFEQ
jgi:hypothetical protein